MAEAALIIDGMEFRETVLRECRRRKWGPYELWQAIGGEKGPVYKQTIYAWWNGLTGTDGKHYFPELREKNLKLVASALGLDLLPVLPKSSRKGRKT